MYLPSDVGEFSESSLLSPVTNKGTFTSCCEFVVISFSVTRHFSYRI